MTKWSGQTLFKGAGPGTNWWSNDARLTGFTVAASSLPTPGAALTHITRYSHPSPYVSLSTSFAVAAHYALSGPMGAATSTTPGYVYEVDPTQASCLLVDPIEVLSGQWLCHEHDGGPELILGVADPVGHKRVLTTPPRRLRPSPHPAAISARLQALILAARDAEVLAQSVPRARIVNRHAVY